MKQRGFTLVEVVVAVTILGTASVALLGLFGRSVDNIRRVEDLRRYQLAGEEVMKAIYRLPVPASPANVVYPEDEPSEGMRSER